MEENKKGDINSYLSFDLGGEIFASNVKKVLSILKLSRITKIPNAPAYLKGVINLRGEALPVIDTRVKFGMPPCEFTINTCILVLDIAFNGKKFQVGALVDAVLEAMEIEDGNMKPSPSIGDKYQSDYITNMVQHNDQFIIVLDIDKVFTSDEIILRQEANKETAEMEA